MMEMKEMIAMIDKADPLFIIAGNNLMEMMEMMDVTDIRF
jgi:hypothetical protein